MDCSLYAMLPNCTQRMIIVLKIEGAFGLSDREALNGVGIDHRGPHIAVAHEFLNGSNVVIGLK